MVAARLRKANSDTIVLCYLARPNSAVWFVVCAALCRALWWRMFARLERCLSGVQQPEGSALFPFTNYAMQVTVRSDNCYVQRWREDVWLFGTRPTWTPDWQRLVASLPEGSDARELLDMQWRSSAAMSNRALLSCVRQSRLMHAPAVYAVSYTHLTLPTNREV